MRMDKIIEYDENNLFVRVQPGVRLCDLAADAIDHGFMYPPDPGEKTGSIGGNVSTNAGGMRAVKYGTTRDYVLAMTVVLPSGEVLRLGREVAKTSSGYSLLHLMIGSEGTLGVITELSMKLIPNPKEDMSFILSFSDIQTAIAAVPKIKLAGLNPQSIEFMERDIVDSSAEYTGNKIIPTVVDDNECGAYILVTLDGNDEDEIFQRAETLAEIGEEAGAFDRPKPSISMRWTWWFPSTKLPNSWALFMIRASRTTCSFARSAMRVTATCIFIAAETILSVRRFLRSRRVLCMRRTRNATSWAARFLVSMALGMRRRNTCANRWVIRHSP